VIGASLGHGFTENYSQLIRMTPEKWDIISKIFNEAASLKEEERKHFVEKECAGDLSLVAEINSLLSAHDEAGDFIADPIVENLVGEISEMPTLTGKYIGQYRIERSIGRGGMGDVYLATDTRLDRLVGAGADQQCRRVGCVGVPFGPDRDHTVELEIVGLDGETIGGDDAHRAPGIGRLLEPLSRPIPFLRGSHGGGITCRIAAKMPLKMKYLQP